MFPYFTIFGKQIGMYAICSAIGIILCALLITKLGKKEKVDGNDIIFAMVSCVVCGVVIAHILYGMTNISQITYAIKNASSLGFNKVVGILADAFGGMVYYGGFIGAFIGLLLYSKISKTTQKRFYLDVFALSMPLFHTFGRIGCFFSGCCYGKISSFGITIHNNPLVPEINDTKRIPVQLIEAGCNLIIFIVIYLLYKKKKTNHPLIFEYVFLYAPVRFTIEFFRGDEIRGIFFHLSLSQWISIILFITALISLLIYKNKTSEKQND